MWNTISIHPPHPPHPSSPLSSPLDPPLRPRQSISLSLSIPPRRPKHPFSNTARGQRSLFTTTRIVIVNHLPVDTPPCRLENCSSESHAPVGSKTRVSLTGHSFTSLLHSSSSALLHLVVVTRSPFVSLPLAHPSLSRCHSLTLHRVVSDSLDPLPPPFHPFHHRKSNPSVPQSTRTNSTLSDPLPEPSLGVTSPPPSYVHLKPNSRRHSKFTAFSGSSTSSVYSTSDASSTGRAAGLHWTLGEKPDIATVFEEEASGDHLDVDLSATKDDTATTPEQQTLIPAQRKFDPISLSRPSSRPSKDGATRVTSDCPPSSTRYPTLNGQTCSTLVDRSLPKPRAQRSETISSQISAHSANSSRSTHPFASAVVRSVSPPHLPLRDTLQPGNHPIMKSRSHGNLSEVYKMPPPVLAPAHQVTLSSTEDKHDEDLCPVCVESLSFTYRLPGEKPHIVPECGHSLHEVSAHRLTPRQIAYSADLAVRNVSSQCTAMFLQKALVEILESVEYVDSQ